MPLLSCTPSRSRNGRRDQVRASRADRVRQNLSFVIRPSKPRCGVWNSWVSASWPGTSISKQPNSRSAPPSSTALPNSARPRRYALHKAEGDQGALALKPLCATKPLPRHRSVCLPSADRGVRGEPPAWRRFRSSRARSARPPGSRSSCGPGAKGSVAEAARGGQLIPGTLENCAARDPV